MLEVLDEPSAAEHREEDQLDATQDSLGASAPARFDNEITPPAKLFNPWIVAMVVTMGTFMEVLDTSIANVALPHISGGLSASQDEGAWVLTSYLVANAIILPMSGWLSSIMGRKNFYMTSVLFFTVFSAACGLAPTLGMLILFRAAQGLSGGGLQPSVQAILADSFSAEKRGMAMALYTIAILVAPVLGPTLGGWITDNYSWRWIFYINIPVGVICLFLTRIVLQDPDYMADLKKKARGLSVDWAGLGFISIGLATLEIVLDKGQELDWFGSSFIVSFAVIAALALGGGVVWELYTKTPVVNLRLLKDRHFTFCCLIIMGLYAVLYGSTYLLPLYMQQMMGYDATTSGLTLSPAGLVTMLEVPLVGYLLTRGFDPRKMAFSGLVLIASSCWWMASLNLEVSQMDLILPRVVQVLGLGLISVPISTIIFRFVPKEESSQAAGLYALVRNEGGSLGIALVSSLLVRRTQVFQQILGQHVTASTGVVQQALRSMGSGAGNHADNTYLAMAQLYNQMQQQATLLSYMEEFRLLAIVTVCMLPLVFFLKRPPAQKHIELEAH